MAKVILPSALRRHINGIRELDIQGETVYDLLINLSSHYPVLKKYCLNANNELLSFVSYHVNNKDIKGLNGISTAVKAEDVFTIIPALAGG